MARAKKVVEENPMDVSSKRRTSPGLGVMMYFEIETIEGMLGTNPSNPDVATRYIMKLKEKQEEERKRLEQSLKSVKKLPEIDPDTGEELEPLKKDFADTVTIFIRDDDGCPAIYDYVIKGFFKNACKALKETDGAKTKGISAYKGKIDNLMFVKDRVLRIHMPEDGEITFCERPLRASTPNGERVALACSEEIPAGSKIYVAIEFLNKSWIPFVKEWLDYGYYNGLGQWHNGGKGRFVWKEITAEEYDEKAYL